jgi:hypothetical protein
MPHTGMAPRVVYRCLRFIHEEKGECTRPVLSTGYPTDVAASTDVTLPQVSSPESAERVRVIVTAVQISSARRADARRRFRDLVGGFVAERLFPGLEVGQDHRGAIGEPGCHRGRGMCANAWRRARVVSTTLLVSAGAARQGERSAQSTNRCHGKRGRGVGSDIET